MLVYRPPARRESPARLVAELWSSLASCEARARDGAVEHERWVALLIDAGVLESALTDLFCPDVDETSAATRALGALSRAAADAVSDSWAGRLAGHDATNARLCALRAALAAVDDALDGASLPDEIVAGVPEGFAYYGLYPETYLQAAHDFHDARRPGAVMCVGIRSIGTSLAAVVGAALDSRGVRVAGCSVRPRGHPFDRRVTIGGALAGELRAHAQGGGWFAVVDEGPGISGSSFAATVEALSALGAAPDRVALFPSWNPEPSSLRSERARAIWARAEKYVAHFEDVWVASGRLGASASRFGAPGAALDDISAGAWRQRLYADRRDWPAVQPQHERRKYLLSPSTPRAGRPVLLKFVGLGRYGRAALERARRLAAAGGTPPPLGLADGFLVSPWADGAPVAPGEADEALLDAVARHLARLRRDFPSSRPVPYGELREMMCVNVTEGCGDAVAAQLSALDSVADLVCRGRTTEVDGRMLPHEWLRTPAGYLKVDAVDHHDDHFLPGAQDVAWDIAGACVELMLDEQQSGSLVTRYVSASDDNWVRLRLPFYRVAYLAYRLGYVTLGAEALGEGADAPGLRALGRRYRAMLERELAMLAAADLPLLPAPWDDVRLVVFDADQTLRRVTAAGRHPA